MTADANEAMKGGTEVKGKWVRKAHDSLSTHHTLGGQTVEHSHKEQNSSVRRQPVRTERRSAARQIQSKRTEFVCPSSTRPQSAGSERHSAARQIQSKRTEFVCPSSTRPQSAGSERHSAARQIQSKRTEFVCQSSTRPHIILSLVQYECKGRD
jgi:hypothetical protein